MCAAIPHPHDPARGQAPQERPAVPADRAGRAHRARPRPRPHRPRPVRFRGPRAAGRPADGRAARRAVRPARAWCTPSARRGPRPCSSARWPPGPAGGPATAGRCPRPGSSRAPSARISAGTWPCVSARAPATPSRSVTCPGWAGTTCASWPSCRTGGRCGASSATCPCWCTGRRATSACCQTDAPISEDPSIRAGS
jgi:hypothetical protein